MQWARLQHLLDEQLRREEEEQEQAEQAEEEQQEGDGSSGGSAAVGAVAVGAAEGAAVGAGAGAGAGAAQATPQQPAVNATPATHDGAAASFSMGRVDGATEAAAAPSSMAAEAGSGANTPSDTLWRLLGAPEGATLRRIAADLDSTELLLQLASREARPLRRRSVDALAAALLGRLPWGPGAAAASRAAAAAWPRSETSEVLRRRRATRASLVTGVLLREHARKQLRRGWRGAAAVGALLLVGARVVVAALAKAAVLSGARMPPLNAVVGSAAVLQDGQKWPSWRRQSWPPRAHRSASEGLGLPSALVRRGPAPRIPPRGRGLPARGRPSRRFRCV